MSEPAEVSINRLTLFDDDPRFEPLAIIHYGENFGTHFDFEDSMISEGHKNNFNTLKEAAKNGDLALVECIDKATAKPVYVVCAVNRLKEGGIEMVPLAKLFDANPYDELEPPRVSDTPEQNEAGSASPSEQN